MTTERCPSCGGAVRPGAPWCTCCWADLRPKPAPPPPPPPPAPVPAPVAPVAAVPPPAAPAAYPAGYPGGYPGAELGWPLAGYGEPGAGVPANVAAGALLMAPSTPVTPVAPLPVAPVPGVDPLTAPLPALLGQPLAAHPAAPAAPAAVTWPCVECGEPNSLDRETCGVCTAPFGGRIARLPDVKGARRKYMVTSIGGVVLFLMMLALLTFATTGSTTVDPGSGDTEPSLETTIDYSTLPEG